MNNTTIKSQAITKYIRTSQYKSSRVLQQIRGRSYSEAKLMLEFMPYKTCKIITKTLDSAFHNMQQHLNVNKKQIKITEAYANKGPVLKRFQPRAQGRAFPIKKPTCHITIKLEV
uniref:Large ribosomal subunit protein uL22c n=1 Tax=Symphyocladiella dendroidea TaxID=2506487 RepID=A0A1Z1M835_9FLOR|nr:ribosomal protein L22 [Symphyocladiella dendroidea]ARW61914.1 ribosomal protein L22 [Symphyocladiella dendroidea]